MKIPKTNITNYKGIIQNTLFLITLFLCNSIFSQYTIPEIPKLQTSVYDYANILSATEKAQLE